MHDNLPHIRVRERRGHQVIGLVTRLSPSFNESFVTPRKMEARSHTLAPTCMYLQKSLNSKWSRPILQLDLPSMGSVATGQNRVQMKRGWRRGKESPGEAERDRQLFFKLENEVMESAAAAVAVAERPIDGMGERREEGRWGRPGGRAARSFEFSKSF